MQIYNLNFINSKIQIFLFCLNTIHNTNAAKWSVWTEWSECILVNDACKQTRSRFCLLDDEEASGCVGENEDSQFCDSRICEGMNFKVYLFILLKGSQLDAFSP